MRIEAYNQVSQLYKTRKSALKNVNSSNKAVRDEVSISSFGRDLQVAKNALKEASDVREDRVDSLKKEIKEGSYSVDTVAFADFLIAKFR